MLIVYLICGGLWGCLVGRTFMKLGTHIKLAMCMWEYWVLMVIPIICFDIIKNTIRRINNED